MKAYDVKVRLDDFRPLTWRDLIIPANITFRDLDIILKILWDFAGGHLSQFSFPNEDIFISPNNYHDPFNESIDGSCQIIDEFFDIFKKCYWEYDFGDGWSFTIEIKKTVDLDKDYPVIKRYKGEYNPQDDIGGVWGLEKLIKNSPDELTTFDKDFVQMDLEDYKDNYLYEF